jgi:hypothetical protein
MRIIVNKFFVILIYLLGMSTAFAGPNPPPPNNGKKPPPPPGLPLDENILILLILAILFGIFILYNHKLKTKNSN